jgi:hypothetical protein
LDWSRCLLQEDREGLAVLQRKKSPLGELEFDREAELGDVPIARPADIADRNGEVVEFHHRPAPGFRQGG